MICDELFMERQKKYERKTHYFVKKLSSSHKLQYNIDFCLTG